MSAPVRPTSFFITGTDTDCGKTYATGALLHGLRQCQYRVVGLKPVASGCVLQEGALVSPDALYLQQYQSDVHPPDTISPWTFLPSIAPHLAAAEVGQSLSVQDIHAFCQSSAWQSYDFCLIEGAGGLMVPLNAQETWVDFIHVTRFPIILVVGIQLGCMNHALLTAATILQQRLPSLGWIANIIQPTMLRVEDNIQALIRRMPLPLLGILPYQKSVSTGCIRRLLHYTT